MKFFSADDFNDIAIPNVSSILNRISEMANKKLEREAKVVYGNGKVNDSGAYSIEKFAHDTHRALLVCIEEIEKPKCEHVVSCSKSRTGPWRYTNSEGAFYCSACGVNLKPTGWEVVDE